MSLDKYVAKRDFTKTKEPKSGKSKAKGSLVFVIQKHDASRLHYDLRLEMDGVLKSWAVPKGPSTDPKVKRLAMMVEDHPYDYRKFEGLIPRDEYGGGTVIVWDEGTYTPIEEIKGKKAQEKHLLAQLKAGSLKIKIAGQKLKGEFALVKTKGMGENGWLLIKHNDEFATTKDITKSDKSVISGKTIAAMEKTGDKIWSGGGEQKVKATDVKSVLKKAKKAAFPKALKPMLATLVDEPFDDPHWQYEVKWDGYRTLAYLKSGKVELWSRNNKSFNEKFYPIFEALQELELNAVVDGEIIVVDENGKSSFSDLQNWRSEADGELVFYVFDLLWLNGKSLIDLPLSERQSVLNTVFPTDDDRLRLSKVFKTSGIDFFRAAEKMNLEGIIAKKSDSTYLPDKRAKEWLKIKVSKRQEVIIAGFTKNDDSTKQFSSLLLGVYEKGALHYAGKVGTGFSVKLQKELITKFKPLIIEKSPFKIEPDINKPSRFRRNPPNATVTWLKPDLVCEVAFSEITPDGVFRHPSYKGLRIDKKAKDVTLEKAIPTTIAVAAEDSEEMIKPRKASSRKTLLNPKDETQVRKICGHDLKFTHLSKLYWPEDKVSKRDMFNYYYQVAEVILPYLKDRPMSLNRFPGGIHSKSFYQKDVTGKAPDWVKTFPYQTSDGEDKEYLVATDEASLLWMATLGCIEMNPWFSRVKSPDHPDYCVIDLDPDQNTFDQVIEAALEVKKVLDDIDVPCYCKTSGSTGMHIYIPLAAKYTYDQSQLFARILVNIVHKRLPDFTSLERMIANRKGKMYLDFLQNRPGATIAGAYSLRPKLGATVSMPLDWKEVKPGLKMTDFTIFNAVERIKKKGDLFKGVLGGGIDLEEAIKKAKSLYG